MANRIKELRKAKDMTLLQLAEKLNVTESTVQRYESGNIKNLKYETMVALAEILKTTPSYLMGWDNTDSLPPYPNIAPVTTRRFPVLGSVSCGEPILMSEEHDLQIEADANIDADFVLYAHGDSMIGAQIHDGDVVFVRKQPTVENGQIAVVAIDDEATLKRFYRYNDLIVLRAENPLYPDIEIRPEDNRKVSILGRALRVQIDLI